MAEDGRFSKQIEFYFFPMKMFNYPRLKKKRKNEKKKSKLIKRQRRRKCTKQTSK